MKNGPEIISLSPDGRQLALKVFLWKEGTTCLDVMPAAGGGTKTIVPDIGGSSEVSWSIDGRSIFAARQARLWRVPADGGDAQPIDVPLPRIRGVVASPDGRRLALLAFSEEQKAVWAIRDFASALRRGR